MLSAFSKDMPVSLQTALGGRVALTRLSDAEPGKQSGPNRAVPEESRARPAPPALRWQRYESAAASTTFPTQTPHRPYRGASLTAHSHRDRILPHPEAQEEGALPSSPPEAYHRPFPLIEDGAPTRAAPQPRPAAAPLARQGEAESRRVPTGRQRRQALLGCRGTPAHLAARPPSAPAAPRPQRPTPLRFRRATKAPAADRQPPTAPAEDQTSSGSGTRSNLQQLRNGTETCTGAGRAQSQRPTRSPAQGERSERKAHGEREKRRKDAERPEASHRAPPAERWWSSCGTTTPNMQRAPLGGPRPQRPAACARRGARCILGAVVFWEESSAAAAGRRQPPLCGLAGERAPAHARSALARAAAGKRGRGREGIWRCPLRRGLPVPPTLQRAAPRRAGPGGTPAWGFTFPFGSASRGTRIHGAHRLASGETKESARCGQWLNWADLVVG